MKLIAKDAAIAALAVLPDEVRPLEALDVPRFIEAIADRYGLAKVPTLEQTKAQGAKFQNGRMKIGSKEHAITELAVYNDAFSVTTNDTDDSLLVLTDLVKWLRKAFHFREPTTPPIHLYQSDLIVAFDNDPQESFTGIGEFLHYIFEAMTPPNAHTKKPVVFSRIAFGADPSVPGVSPEFTIERRQNTPWRFKHYFSKAHMPTERHVRGLELLDKALGRGRSKP